MTRLCTIRLVLTCLFATSCATSAAREERDATVPVDGRSPFLREADSLEAVALRNAGGAARRIGGRLELRVASDSVITLLDNSEDGDSLVFYRLRPEFRELGYFLVGVLFYEGSEFQLVHERTGKSVVVHGHEPPSLSPAARKLVAASGDFETGYYPNTMQIVRLEPDGPVLEWSFVTGEYESNSGWAASDPNWLSERTIALTMHLPRDASPLGPRVPVWLDNVNGRWQVRTYRAMIDGVAPARIGTDTQTVQVNATMSEQLARHWRQQTH